MKMFKFYQLLLAADTAATGDAAAEGGIATFLPMVAWIAFFGIIMYFMIYLPQKRKDKKAKELMNSLSVGQTVTTHSGVVGKVVNIKDDVVTIASGVERTQIEYKKWAIRDVEQQIQAYPPARRLAAREELENEVRHPGDAFVAVVRVD